MVNITKCVATMLKIFSGAAKPTATAKCYTKNMSALLKLRTQPRLFSIKSDSVIGTEITNNITGTRYFAEPKLTATNVHIGLLPRKINADGTYSTISEDLFNKMLSCLRKNPASWNPVIKSKPDLGKEVIINRYGFDRYFRPATSPHIPNDKITCIKQDGRYYSMKLGQFDDMLLDIFDGKA